MTSPTSSMNVSSALALGLREAVSLASATLALFAARAMAGLALGSLGWALFGTWWVGRAPVGLAAAAGLLVFWLCCELLAGTVLSGALAQGRARLLGEPVPPLPEAMVGEASRGLVYPLWSFAVQLLVTLWRWSALWAAATLYFRAIARGSGGFVGSAALALAIVLALPLSLLAMVWLRVALVDSVHARRPVGTALFEAVRLLRAHLFTPLLVILLAAVLAAMTEGLVSGTLAPLATPGSMNPEVLKLAVLASLAGGVLAAFPAAFFELTGWHGLMALRLSWAGTLPPSEPTRAQARSGGMPPLAGAYAGGASSVHGPVLQARPIASEVIVDARPVTSAPLAGAEEQVGAQPQEPALDAVVEATTLEARPSEGAPSQYQGSDTATGQEDPLAQRVPRAPNQDDASRDARPAIRTPPARDGEEG